MNEYIMECIRCLGIKFLLEDATIKAKWRHGDKHYLAPLGSLLGLWETYKEQVGIVHCDKCIHNVGIRDNTDFYEEDIVCDYWDCDGLCSWDYCSYGKRKEG